jgi:hypothetical protein
LKNVIENGGSDRRVTRTKAALWHAFRTLLQQQSWNDISIKGICDSADVARSSFYAHFESKTELLHFGYWELVKEIPATGADGNAEGFASLNWTVDHITQNPGFFTKVTALGSDRYLFSQFTNILEQILTQELEAQGIQSKRSTIVFAINGAFAVIREWMVDRCSTDPETLKGAINELVERSVTPRETRQ